MNLNGAVRDEDVFVLGDEDLDDSEDDSEGSGSDSPLPVTPPPAYTDGLSPDGRSSSGKTIIQDDEGKDIESTQNLDTDVQEGSKTASIQKYYIKPTDTLIGIALRFGVDGRLICRFNDLPPSTLRTTPHLLHTRTFLTLPSSARGADLASSSSSSPEDAEHVAQRVHERAQKRFQMLTKERDSRVAKAYIAVADLDNLDGQNVEHSKATSVDDTPEKVHETLRKRHVGSSSDASVSGQSNLEERALDRYLNDDEWEERERRDGRKVSIAAFPMLRPETHSNRAIAAQAQKSWWKWR